MRVSDLRIVLVPQIFSGLEVAVASYVKMRGKVPLLDTPADIDRFLSVVSSYSVEKKVILLVTAVGSDVVQKRFEALVSQYLARIVTRTAELKLIVGMAVPAAPVAVAPSVASVAKNKATAAAAPAAPAVAGADVRAPLHLWIKAAADLVFLVLIEAIMAFWQRPATMLAAEKLSLENAQALLRRDISEEDLAVGAALVVMRRQSDYKLAHPTLPENLAKADAAADLLAHLPNSIKAKVAVFDDGARMAVPVGETFLARMGSDLSEACVAQLGTWALAVKADKAELNKAVQRQVAALMPPVAGVLPVAGVPPVVPPAAAPRQRNPGRALLSCLKCEKAGRVAAGHSRETCAFYKCMGCEVMAPGHVWRNCPNPSVGGPCPPHEG